MQTNDVAFFPVAGKTELILFSLLTNWKQVTKFDTILQIQMEDRH